MFSQIKNKIPKPIKNILRKAINLTIAFLDTTKRKIRKTTRLILKKEFETGHHFAILVIKKTVYADMAITNINSLYYLNPGHIVTLYCDTLCYNYLKEKKSKFDYPEKVIIQNSFGLTDKPWQYYKIETLIQAAQHDQIETDADGIWHENPVVDKNKITILVMAQKIKANKTEAKLIEKIFQKKEWTEFNHYVSGFVSIPKNLMTEKIAQDLRFFNESIFNNPLAFIEDKIERENMRRLSEELAVNLTLQTNFATENIATLKSKDGPGDKKSLQSLYYGCANQIIE